MSDKNSSIEDLCQEVPQLVEHLKAVLLQNRTMNLTSIKNIEAGKILHIEDSLAALPELDAAPHGIVADLGSGAGFPGIPLALVSKRQTVLVESNNKKASFLKEFISKNDLDSSIAVAAERSEELALVQRNAFAVVTARAVAELPALLELGAPLLRQGGQFLAFKGRIDADELERGNKAAERLGLRYVSLRSYVLSDNMSCRCILVYEKFEEPATTLPRRPGMAVKRPLA